MKHNISEEIISNTDVSSILKTAASMDRNGIVRKAFKGLRKDKIELPDLQKAWIDAGRPDDTKDIAVILKDNFGFSEKEIKKVFTKVFGDSGEEEFDTNSIITPGMQKLVDYCKQNGLIDDVKAFIEKEYGEKLGLVKIGSLDKLKRFFGKKAVTEEIREIFEEIVKEEREDRFKVIKQLEQTHLGRTKK